MMELGLAFVVVLSLVVMFVLVWPILQDYYHKEGLWAPTSVTFGTTEASAEYEAIADACRLATETESHRMLPVSQPQYPIDRPAMNQPRFQTHAGHINEVAKFTVEYEGVEETIVFQGFVKSVECSRDPWGPLNPVETEVLVRVIGDNT